jgi:hypothetical protein
MRQNADGSAEGKRHASSFTKNQFRANPHILPQMQAAS